MPPTLALALWFILLVALLRFDPAKEPGTSVALWVPLIWMFIIGSRLPSQWLGVGSGIAAQALEEGNPLDRTIFSVLILMAVAIVTLRSFNWGGFIFRNLALVTFLLFALASVVWSDYPFVAFKRWFRDLGSYFIILVVLSDPQPLEAVRTILRRFCYLLIPLSVLLVKYFPYLAKSYGMWSGAAEYIGATTSKNMLGNVCMLSGIFFFWDTVTRWSGRKERRNKRIIRVNAIFLVMTLWLLQLSHSATSQVCLVIGCVVIAALHTDWGGRHLTLVRVMIPATFCLYIILAFGLGLQGEFASRVGRDATLTDRTIIWQAVLSQHTNPLVGTGYESFWIGPRLERVWQLAGGVNEAHNGYLEVYLNLGGIGVALLLALLIASYRTIWQKFASSFDLASFSLAMWAVILFYNVTEAAFKGGLLWLILLMGGIVLPDRIDARLPSAAASKALNPVRRYAGTPLRTTTRHE